MKEWLNCCNQSFSQIHAPSHLQNRTLKEWSLLALTTHAPMGFQFGLSVHLSQTERCLRESSSSGCQAQIQRSMPVCLNGQELGEPAFLLVWLRKRLLLDWIISPLHLDTIVRRLWTIFSQYCYTSSSLFASQLLGRSFFNCLRFDIEFCHFPSLWHNHHNAITILYHHNYCDTIGTDYKVDWNIQRITWIWNLMVATTWSSSIQGATDTSGKTMNV